MKLFWRPKRRCRLKVFLILALTPFCLAEWNHFSNFGKGALEEHFCEIILKSGHWHGRCHLKVFLFLALMAILLSEAEPF